MLHQFLKLMVCQAVLAIQITGCKAAWRKAPQKNGLAANARKKIKKVAKITDPVAALAIKEFILHPGMHREYR